MNNDTNDFAGRVVAMGGTLSYTSVANNGVDSALGDASAESDQMIRIGNDATLKYTGSGHSTDRDIFVADTATVDASGAGTLTWNGNTYLYNDGDIGYSDLKLGGTGTGVMNGHIMLGPVGDLEKTGSGTWTVAGKNLWRDTTVSAGKLIVSGTAAKTTYETLTPAGNMDSSGVITDVVTSNYSVGDIISGKKMHHYNRIMSIDSGTQMTLTSTRDNGTTTTGEVNEIINHRYGPLGIGTTTVAAGATLQGSGGSLTYNDITNSGTVIFDQTTTDTYSKTISGTGAITKDGNGRLTLTGANTATGAVTVQRVSSGSGTSELVLNNSSANNDTITGDLTISSNSSVELGASNQIANTADLKLSGGSFFTKGYSEGTASAVGMDQLNLISSSTLDMGGGDSILTFTNDAYTAGTLTISSWAGNPNNTTTGRYGDQLIMNTNTSNIGVGNIVFSDWGNANAVITGDLGGGFYEIAPNVSLVNWNVDADGTWVTAGNWDAGEPDAAGKIVIMSKALTADRTVTVGSNKTLATMQITGGDGTNDYTITGSSLTFDATAGNASLQMNGTNAATIASNIVLSDNLNIMNSSSGTLTLSGIMSGAQTVDINNGGNVLMSNDNTYSGATSINSGTLTITGSVDSAITVIAGGTLAGGNGATSVSSEGMTLTGGIIAPGNGGIAQLKIGDAVGDTATWNHGTYVWEVTSGMGDSGSNSSSGGGDTVNEASGVAGTAWDVISFTGTLDLSSGYTNAYNINITSNSTYTGYDWDVLNEVKIVEANSITGFNADYFNLDASGFNDAVGSWWVGWSIVEHDNALWLQYRAVPEPSTYVMVGGLVLLIGYRVRVSLKNKKETEETEVV